MKNKKIYYSLPTIRKYRRFTRKVLKSFHVKPCKGICVLRDEHGANILKTRRWKNRIKNKKSEII